MNKESTSAYYYQNRKGKRIRVRKGKNRITAYRGSKVNRLAIRGEIGNVYGKGVISQGDRSKSIKKEAGVKVSRQNGQVKATARIGSLKGGISGGRRMKRVDAIAYSQNENETAEFSSGYYYQTRNGKRVRVKKHQDNSKLVRGAELLGTAAGLTGGAALGAKLVKMAGRNGAIRNSAMLGGGLVGGAIALMLADKLERKYG